MGLIKVGRVIRPHGVKGAMKVSSDFKYKKDVFKPGNILTINKKDYKLISYSFAGGGQLDIAALEGINTIDDVIAIRQNDIYVDKRILNTDEILDQELIGLNVYLNNELIGMVEEVESGINPLIILYHDNKKVYIPRQDVFIASIDIDQDRIELTNEAGGLL